MTEQPASLPRRIAPVIFWLVMLIINIVACSLAFIMLVAVVSIMAHNPHSDALMGVALMPGIAVVQALLLAVAWIAAGTVREKIPLSLRRMSLAIPAAAVVLFIAPFVLIFVWR